MRVAAAVAVLLRVVRVVLVVAVLVVVLVVALVALVRVGVLVALLVALQASSDKKLTMLRQLLRVLKASSCLLPPINLIENIIK